MRWIKASERMPTLEDADSEGDVCVKSCGDLLLVYWGALFDNEEWLEGWNVQEEPVRYVIAKVDNGEVSTHDVAYTGLTAKQALIQHAQFYGPGKYQVDDGRTKQVFTVESEVVYRVTDLRGE